MTSNKELYKYLPTTGELNANIEYAQTYFEMAKKVSSLQLEFGEDLSALSMVCMCFTALL